MSDAIADPRQVLTNFTGGDVRTKPASDPGPGWRPTDLAAMPREAFRDPSRGGITAC